MAGLMVAGSFLSAALNVLFDRMASTRVIDFLCSKELDENLLRKLKIKLLSAERVLNDAEKKQLTDPHVRTWLHELRDAIYDAEDLVYEINTEAERSELEPGRSGSRSLSQVPNFFSSSRFTVPDIEQRIEKIHSMLEFIVKEKDGLGLKEGALETRPFLRLSEAPLVDDSDIYGRDADKEAILKLLLSEEVGGGDNKVSVIPIVGMGGIGKTTLAQLVYNDIDRHVIDKPFDLKAWITVSEESDVFTLTKTIYEAVLKRAPDSCDKQLFQLQRQLKELLENKKFLFVFDDVWNLNFESWSDLKGPLKSAAHGSKIIVTTRSKEIASVMGTVPGHELQTLSEENCWQLFAKHVFNNGEASGHPDLVVIGKQIVEKCKGLPLAIKSLGCLLHSERNPKEWEIVLKNDIWDLAERKNGILPALWLSYYYLPPHLKRCFAYCSLFPKDYRIGEEELILLWMAEDLLQPQKNKTLEEVGMDYLKDLTSRSFFHHHRYGGFTMHDLVNDLANFVSGESCLSLDENYSVGCPRKTRYLSILGSKVHDTRKIEEISKNKVLRTLLVLYGSSLTLSKHYKKCPELLQSMRCLRVFSASSVVRFRYEEPYITKLLDSIGGLKLLRYLDLSYNFTIKEVPDVIGTLCNLQTLLFKRCMKLISLPDSIGNLKHLRYLNLSYTLIERLPDTICNLRELHTLDLTYCQNLSCLPTNITTLINLRHLKTSGTRVMPLQLSNLTNLESLEGFVVDKNGGGSNFRALGKLQYLRGRLCIIGLENVENVGDVSEANLKNKKGITELRLVWNDESDDSHKPRELLNRLRPHTNLKILTIKNYGSTNFPDWVGHHSFSCITSVDLIGCKNCYLLPPLGQLPSLKELFISGFDMVERIGEEFYYNGSSSATKPFKSLEWMSFSNMPRWKEWSRWGSDDEEGGVFSKVGTLKLSNCEMLNGACLPDNLPSLKTLKLSNCEMLNGACLPDNLPSLKRLEIGGRNQLVGPLSRCHYPSLGDLCISECGEVESFPQGTLPSTITYIKIQDCQKLVSLSEEGWPSNLKSLLIFCCQKLFAVSNLPASLSRLVISDCPLLEPRCQREIGEDWHKISHIPLIEIGGQQI